MKISCTSGTLHALKCVKKGHFQWNCTEKSYENQLHLSARLIQRMEYKPRGLTVQIQFDYESEVAVARQLLENILLGTDIPSTLSSP